LFEERRSGKIQPAVEVRFRRKDGTAIWTLLSARPIFRHGQFAGALDMFTDVTGRRLAEERFRVFFELSAAGYALIDPVSHRFLSVNRRFCEITGRDANQLVGLSFEDITHPEDRADDDERFGALFAGRVGEVSTEKRYLRPDGTVVWVHLTTSMVRDPTGKPELQISVVEDITARKKAEQEFEAELQRQITQRTRELDEKTKQLESFCYTVAHDLRAPLRAINGFADYAIEDIGSDHPQASGFLDRIRKSTTRLDALITDLLNYTRIDQLPVTHDRIDLRPVIDSALRDLDEEIRQSDAVIQVKEPLPAVIGEQSILEQMVLNLVSNAVKFHRPDEPPHVDIFARDGDGRVRLFVQDRGIGIPPEYHQRIFRVFERLQTSRGYPGTGMGLAIVARGAERLGGECGVESEPGKGSTFWIDLKRA
jgi:PAS domain S-box-containing protein